MDTKLRNVGHCTSGALGAMMLNQAGPPVVGV